MWGKLVGVTEFVPNGRWRGCGQSDGGWLLPVELHLSRAELELLLSELHLRCVELELMRAELHLRRVELELMRAELHLRRVELELLLSELHLQGTEMHNPTKFVQLKERSRTIPPSLFN